VRDRDGVLHRMRHELLPLFIGEEEDA
jgi:hypothetical protein